MNNINRHNYETFFLLYIDNELSVTEKKTVDEFVDANPDLQEELIMLQQSIYMIYNKFLIIQNGILNQEVDVLSVKDFWVYPPSFSFADKLINYKKLKLWKTTI